MILHSPMAIAPNLEPGLQIGNHWITIKYGKLDMQERRIYFKITFLIDRMLFNDESISASLHAPHNLQSGLCSCLSFLYACLESQPSGENADLFGKEIIAAFENHTDEIAMLGCQLEEEELIVE